MEITLYQINPDRDYEDYEFKHFEFAKDQGYLSGKMRFSIQ